MGDADVASFPASRTRIEHDETKPIVRDCCEGRLRSCIRAVDDDNDFHIRITLRQRAANRADDEILAVACGYDGGNEWGAHLECDLRLLDRARRLVVGRDYVLVDSLQAGGLLLEVELFFGSLACGMPERLKEAGIRQKLEQTFCKEARIAFGAEKACHAVGNRLGRAAAFKTDHRQTACVRFGKHNGQALGIAVGCRDAWYAENR